MIMFRRGAGTIDLDQTRSPRAKDRVVITFGKYQHAGAKIGVMKVGTKF